MEHLYPIDKNIDVHTLYYKNLVDLIHGLEHVTGALISTECIDTLVMYLCDAIRYALQNNLNMVYDANNNIFNVINSQDITIFKLTHYPDGDFYIGSGYCSFYMYVLHDHHDTLCRDVMAKLNLTKEEQTYFLLRGVNLYNLFRIKEVSSHE